MGDNLRTWSIYAGCMMLVEFSAWAGRKKTVKYYRWDEQGWWNYDPADAPGNFPSQLGDPAGYDF